MSHQGTQNKYGDQYSKDSPFLVQTNFTKLISWLLAAHVVPEKK